jgi:hypothetical protein
LAARAAEQRGADESASKVAEAAEEPEEAEGE